MGKKQDNPSSFRDARALRNFRHCRDSFSESTPFVITPFSVANYHWGQNDYIPFFLFGGFMNSCR